jgi:two-component system, NtrC family, sensor kinase
MKVKLFNKLSVKLFLVTSLVLIIVFSIYTYFTVRNLEEDFTSSYKQNVYNISDIIKRSTRHSMLLNKREDVYEIIKTIGNEPGVKTIRIYNKQGVISYSSDTTERNKTVDMNAEACIICHENNTISRNIARKDSLRIFSIKDERYLGLINPIRNEKDCFNSECHAHKPTTELLGILDVVVSMNKADKIIQSNKRDIIINSVIITLLISGLSLVFILILVNKPLKIIQEGISALGKGDWNYRINMKSRSELGVISSEFNDMARLLSSAYREIKDWSETLNDKVEQKTAELKNIYEQVLQIEKLASLGKLSATVAHELNNPLEGILTYSKLIIKKIKERNDIEANPKIIEFLNLIADEASRCGKIVKDLLLFSHRDTEQFRKNDLIEVIDKSVMLINHHLEINNVKLIKDFPVDSLEVFCNPQKIQQAMISLLINAIESMHNKGGEIKITLQIENQNAILRIKDQGDGISQKDLPFIFEPFYTTKDSMKGTGLGLSVVYGIIKVHNGKIEVEETSEKGTTFKIVLPINQNI